MKLISVWSLKGGVGKSTIAINLAAGLAALGGRVVLADLDAGQQSCLAFQRHAVALGVELPFEVVAGYPERPPECDYFVVDHPPSVETDVFAKTIVIPMMPGPLDAWSIGRMREDIAKRAPKGARLINVINGYKSSRSEDREFAAINRDCLVISDRSVFRRVMGRGRTVYDSDILNLYAARDAKKEIGALVAEVR